MLQVGGIDPMTRDPAKLDLIDRKIVAVLMNDATTPIAQIAHQVGLSQTPCWKRIQKLEANGVIKRRVALVDPSALDVGLSVFVGIKAPEHGSAWREAFITAINALPEVMEVWRMTGETDYLLRVAVRDMSAFDRFYTILTDVVAVKSVNSQFALECVRHSTAYPIDTHSR